MLRGINAMTIDEKGRLAFPARYRNMFSAPEQSFFVITVDTEAMCLLLYPATAWQFIEMKLQSLPSFNPVARRIQRLLIGHATDVELDSHARLLLPPLLREYAQLNKKVVMIGQGNKFEIWNESIWQKQREEWLAESTPVLEQLPEELRTFSL